jgi:hypothetical protein
VYRGLRERPLASGRGGTRRVQRQRSRGLHQLSIALARSDADDSYAEGYFLQLTAFTDDPDDDIWSETTGDHSVNPTFDQLGRTDHDCGDISAGDRAPITLRMTGDSLVCSAHIDGCSTIEVRTTDVRFGSGTIALSTLNADGRYDWVQVCEAL